MQQDIRSEQDAKQKEYLRKLGYSDNVINALFPESSKNVFLDNGNNLIAGFVVALMEREQ